MAVSRRDFIQHGVGAAVGFGLASAVSPGPASARPQDEAFDVIVVGAGSAGCVVAHRLSGDADTRVLLVEAGGPDRAPELHVPGRWTTLIGSEWDWRYVTEPEPGLGGRQLAFPRGKAFGGSSAINAMVCTRGHRLDYDHWNYLGNAGWSYADVLPYFVRSEDNSRGASAYHGAGGPLRLSDTIDPSPPHLAFLDAARELGYRARPDWDFDGAQQENGAGFYQKNIKDGRRHSAAAAFLTPILSRPNLTVRPYAQATRLVFERSRAVSLEYVRDGRVERARARREVVVCGGVVESPRLLLRSGVGPADELRALGIPVVADLPGVGANLQDHVKLSVRWVARRELPPSTVSAGLFLRSRGGLVASSPDLQFYLGRGTDEPERFVTITVALARPQSRGRIRLRSAEPLAPPVVQANYLQRDADVRVLVEGVRLVRALGLARAFDALRGDEMEPGVAARTDRELEAFIRRAADTIYHGAGTCRMGSDRLAVVDAELRVHGVGGLRVADASVMPDVVNANTHAACVMIGERAAEFLRRSG